MLARRWPPTFNHRSFLCNLLKACKHKGKKKIMLKYSSWILMHSFHLYNKWNKEILISLLIFSLNKWDAYTSTVSYISWIWSTIMKIPFNFLNYLKNRSFFYLQWLNIIIITIPFIHSVQDKNLCWNVRQLFCFCHILLCSRHSTE